MTRLHIPLFVALAVSILSAIDARTQLPHQRMIRKRAPGPLDHVEERAAAFVVPRWPGLEARQGQPPSSSQSNSVPPTSASASASRTSSSAATTSAAATSSSASAASSSAASFSGGLLDSLTGVLGGSQSLTSSTASSTSISSTSSSSSIISSSAVPSSSASVAQPTSQAAAASSSPQATLNIATAAPTQATGSSASLSMIVTTATAPAAEQSQQAQKEKTAKITRNTIISLVVAASCIGGAVAIWTVIRKWKLSPSERFDDRMQPIDWAPTGGAGGMREDAIEEKSHHRTGSAGSHGSFTSGGVGQSEVGHGGARSVHSDAMGHGNGNAKYGAQHQDFPPAHDFTAGANMGGYGQQYPGQQYAGGAGYADLQRGPSMTESTYSRGTGTNGMSYSRGVGYEAQPGASGVPPLPNPYGGVYEYEDYGRQPAQGQHRGF